MDARLLFPSLYIAAADLRGRDVVLTIDRMVIEELRTERGKEKKPVLYFREMERRHRAGKGENKRLVMNKTNMRAIAAATGSYETEEWPGKAIALYPTECQAFGKTVECVRVRETPPRKKGAPPPEPEPPPDAGDAWEEPATDGEEAYL